MQIFNRTLNIDSMLSGSLGKIKLTINNLFSNILEKKLSFNNLYYLLNPTDNFSYILNQILFSNTQSSRELLRLTLKGYDQFDPGKGQSQRILLDLKKEITKTLGKEDFRDKFEKLKAYDHENHLLWLRWGTFKDRFENLSKEIKFKDQPVNIVLPYKIYIEQMPSELQNKFDYYCNLCGLWDLYSPKKVAKCFKLLTSAVKKLREQEFTSNWEWLCDLETLWGYNAKTKLTDVEKELYEWVEPKETKRNNLTNLEYKDKLVKLFKKDQTLAIQKVSGKVEKSIETFLKDPNGWVVNGSSNGVKTMLYDTKKEETVKSSATKPAIYIENRYEDTLREFLQDVEQPPFKPSVKIELGWKDRLIIACGNVDYLRMAYVSYNVERYLPQNNFTTLFGGLKNKIQNYYEAMLLMGVHLAFALCKFCMAILYSLADP